MVDFKEGIVKTNLKGGGIHTVITSIEKVGDQDSEISIWTRRIETDYDGDGNIDKVIIEKYSDAGKNLLSTETRKYKYDNRGNEIKVEYDKGSDGIIEETYTAEYDAKNRPIKQNLNNKTVVYHEYLSDDITSHSWDYGIDGVIDVKEIINETPDYENGNGIRRTEFFRADKNGDLKYDGHSVYGRDENGNIIGDHYNKKGEYNHSTGPGANEHPKGFGL